MLGWYDPLQLAKTGLQVALSTVFGKHADRRFLQAAAKSGGASVQEFYDASRISAEKLWIAYIADVGDGFNSTCTTAYYLTEPTLAKLKPRLVEAMHQSHGNT